MPKTVIDGRNQVGVATQFCYIWPWTVGDFEDVDQELRKIRAPVSSQKVQRMNAASQMLEFWILSSQNVSLVTRVRAMGHDSENKGNKQTFLATIPPMLCATRTILVWKLVSSRGMVWCGNTTNLAPTYVRAAAHIADQRAREIIDIQRASTQFIPVGPVAKAVYASAAELWDLRQPFFRPVMIRIRRNGPCFA